MISNIYTDLLTIYQERKFEMIKTILKNLAHVAAIAATTTAATQLQSGVPVTSGNVLLPALGAAGAAVIGAIVKHFGE